MIPNKHQGYCKRLMLKKYCAKIRKKAIVSAQSQIFSKEFNFFTYLRSINNTYHYENRPFTRSAFSEQRH